MRPRFGRKEAAASSTAGDCCALADGKTASEIADILNISERTANFHIANVITKLNAPNKTAAVIRAGLLGMLG
jgi:DNA-binding CsgD family transcriptional regulator